MVGAVFSQSPSSVLLSQPVNVSVEPYDRYESFAVVNDGAQGTVHGVFQLLQEDGTHLNVKMHLQSTELIRLGDCTQAALFTITFNDTLMAELRGEADIFSTELLIEVQFQYLGRKNEESDIAYIHVTINNFSETTFPDINPTSTESKNSMESPNLCSMKISGGISQICSVCSYRLIVYFCSYYVIAINLIS